MINDSKTTNVLWNIWSFMRRHGLLCISAVATAICFGVCAYYILFPAEGYLHSDCTDSLLWANASVESGDVFDENFRYAAMLPFSANLWFIPLIYIFGYSMTAQTVGMMIFLILFTLAAIFMCRSLEWSYTASFCMTSAMLMLLSGSDKLREIMWGHVIYYSWAILIIMVGLGLLVRFMKATDLALTSSENESISKKSLSRSLIYVILLGLLFTGNGTNGFQIIVMSTLAVMAAIAAERFFDGRSKLISKKNLSAITGIVIIGISTLLGLVLLKFLKGDKIANYTSVYSTFSSLEDWYANFSKFFESYFSLFGVIAKSGQALFGKESLPYLVRIVGGVLILVLPIIALIRYKNLKQSGTKQILWAHLVVSAVIMVGFICGKLGNANWRLTPMVGTAVMTSVAFVRELIIDAKDSESINSISVKFRIGVVLTAILALVCAVNANEIRKMPRDYGKDNSLHVLAEELEEKGLKYGYATFWRSQAITLLSDSKVKCRETLVNSNGIITDYYQSSKLWYEDQEGIDKYFVILSKSEYNKVKTTDHWSEIMDSSYIEHFECAGFYVYVFSDNVILLGEFNG